MTRAESPDAVLTAAAPTQTAELARAQQLAAPAVMALRLDRPALELTGVDLRGGGLRYARPVLDAAARLNQPLREQAAMLRLAGLAQLQLEGLATPAAEAASLAEVAAWLASVLDEDEAQEADAYARVLLARARALLRQWSTEVSVVALGLLEHGALDAAEVRHRLQCVQGIRNTLLN